MGSFVLDYAQPMADLGGLLLSRLHNLHKELYIRDILTFLSFCYLLRCLGLIVYRLYFCPIARFPGPKLAALSYWYEAYYDFISNGGSQFAFHIKRLHAKYGPVVRISPEELHIDDPEFYDAIFCNSQASRPIDKMERFRYRLNHPDSTLSTTKAEDHKMRRAALAPFFSRSRVRGYNDDLQVIIDRVSHRLETEFKGSGHVVSLNFMWASVTADMIMELAFGCSSNMSYAPEFRSSIPESLFSVAFLAHYVTHFQIIGSMMKYLPDRILYFLLPAAKPLLEFRQGMRNRVQEIMSEEKSESSRRTLFHEILASNISTQDKSLERLTQEAILVNGAGIETTTWTLTVASCYILCSPSVNQRLRKELKVAMPDPNHILPWDELENLPYLKAVILEALRLSFGSVQRLPRVNRLWSLTYLDQEIPPNTPIGMDAFHMHTNELVFPNAREFLPERWLGNPRGPDGKRPLSQYLVSFSRGSRGCIGKDLAMMELYVALATLFRRHELELFETSRQDVDFAMDLVKPMPRRGSKGVRVIIR